MAPCEAALREVERREVDPCERDELDEPEDDAEPPCARFAVVPVLRVLVLRLLRALVLRVLREPLLRAAPVRVGLLEVLRRVVLELDVPELPRCAPLPEVPRLDVELPELVAGVMSPPRNGGVLRNIQRTGV